MRPRHWWVAAVGAGVLASGAFIAPAALAAPAPAAVVAVKPAPKAKPAAKKPAHPVVKNGRVAAKHHPDTKPGKPPVKPGRPGHHHHKPEYPPHATPSVSLSVASHVHIGRTTTVTAKVSINNTPVAGALVGLYGSIDGGKNWKKYTEATTAPDGTVSFAYTPHHSVTLRVVVAGGPDHAPTQSDGVPLNVKR